MPPEARGYVCAVGTPPWAESDMLSELDAFLEAYRVQRAVRGSRTREDEGLHEGLFHSFALWFVVRRLQPSAIVADGRLGGSTSWLLQCAYSWSKPLTVVQLGPGHPTPRGSPAARAGLRVITLRNSTDLAQVGWRGVGVDPAASLVVSAGRGDQMRRLEEAHALGFAHLLFSHNYLPGTGDGFSIKDACDGGGAYGGAGGEGQGSEARGAGGRLREAFAGRRSRDRLQRRCRSFPSSCALLEPERFSAERRKLLAVGRVVWEAPPVVRLGHSVYKRARGRMRRGLCAGPANWTEAHSALALAATKPALIDRAEFRARIQRSLQIPPAHSKAVVYAEAGRYMHLVYVRTRAPRADRHIIPLPVASSSTARRTAWLELNENLRKAARAARPDGTVLVLYSNSGFSRLLRNALCSLRRYSLLARSLVLTHDRSFRTPHTTQMRELSASSEGRDAAPWGTDAYRRVVASKLRAFTAVVEAGYSLVAVDADVVFVSDPRPLLVRLATAVHQVAFMNDGHRANASRTPACATDPHAMSGVVNTGFFYARATENVRKLMRRALGILDSAHPALDGTDQGAVNLAMQEVPEAELKRQVLDCHEVQNGWLFFGNSNTGLRELAVIAHANWMVGEDTKRTCLRAAGLWFVSDEGGCTVGSPRSFASSTIESGEVQGCR